ncbi:MAG: DUF561 domain-containing protein [Vampirovibrionales bacterium]|nr:DUF561 domain-containing protein [Vampirovibrionales bacterium]
MTLRLQDAIAARTLVKVIAGIDNTDAVSVSRVVEAARLANAPALDVSADEAIVSLARQGFDGILFASSVEPAALARAVELGADVAELGNFDALYAAGTFLTAPMVKDLAQQAVIAVQAVNATAAVCVTIPGHLDTVSQQALATDLAAMGVAMIQTEGAVRVLSAEPSVKALSTEDQVALTLSNTQALVSVGVLPVMTATSLTVDTVADAITAGACGVGVGRVVRQHRSVEDMTLTIKGIMKAVEASARPAMVALSA